MGPLFGTVVVFSKCVENGGRIAQDYSRAVSVQRIDWHLPVGPPYPVLPLELPLETLGAFDGVLLLLLQLRSHVFLFSCLVFLPYS